VAIRPIHSYPDAVLKRPADAVTDIDGTIATLVEDMAETMYAAPGIGLAAPQLGVGRRVLVLDVPDEDEGPGKHLMKLVNPEIVERDGSIVWEEGCLSVPDFTAPVTRAKRILVRAWTPEQKEIEIEAEDLLAVALQHEIDHLDGKLFLDRLSRLKRDLYKARQRKLERQGRSEDRPRDRPADRPGGRRSAL
jgi:peptide deformylase